MGMIGKDISSPKGDKDEAVTKLFAELERGIKRRRTEETRWEHNEKFDNMRQWGGELGEGDQITVNKLGAYIRDYRARVCYNDPRVKLTPKTSDGWSPISVPIAGVGGQPELDEMGMVKTKQVIPAKAKEALVNGILSAPMQNLQQTSGLLTKAGIIGYGVLKCGFRPIFETEQEPEGEQIIPIRDNKLDISGFKRNRFDGSIMEDDNGRFIDRNSDPVWEDFFVRWVPYRSIIIDPDGGNYWEDHRWVAEEELRSLEEVKNDPLFKDTKELEASGMRTDGDDEMFSTDTNGSDWSDSKSDPEKSDLKMVRLFHVYDMVNERYKVLADGYGKALRDVTWAELKISDHPYSDFRPNQIMGEFYPRPPATDLSPINEWYNIARQMEYKAMRNSVRKAFVRKGTMNAANLEQFTNDDDLAVVELDIPSQRPLSDAILPYTPPPVNAAIYGNSQKIAQDFDEVGGMSGESRGVASSNTATQVNYIESGSTGRIDHDRKIMAETWRRIFKKLIDYIDANMTTERAVMLQGTDGQVFQALIDPDMIAGDFDVDVDFEDMAPVNSGMQAAGRVQIAQIAGQAPHLFTSEPLVRGWLEPYGIKDQGFVDALVQASQMQMQMLMMQGQQAPGPVPEAGAPTSEADAISQSAAGQQAPRMQGAS